MSTLEHGLKTLLLIATVIVGGGIATATLLRSRGLMWTWAMLGLPLALSARGDQVDFMAGAQAVQPRCARVWRTVAGQRIGPRRSHSEPESGAACLCAGIAGVVARTVGQRG